MSFIFTSTCALGASSGLVHCDTAQFQACTRARSATWDQGMQGKVRTTLIQAYEFACHLTGRYGMRQTTQTMAKEDNETCRKRGKRTKAACMLRKGGGGTNATEGSKIEVHVSMGGSFWRLF